MMIRLSICGHSGCHCSGCEFMTVLVALGSPAVVAYSAVRWSWYVEPSGTPGAVGHCPIELKIGVSLGAQADSALARETSVEGVQVWFKFGCAVDAAAHGGINLT